MLLVLPATFEPRLQQTGCKVFFVGGKTRKIAVQLVLQQSPKQVARFLLLVLPYLYNRAICKVLPTFDELQSISHVVIRSQRQQFMSEVLQ